MGSTKALLLAGVVAFGAAGAARAADLPLPPQPQYVPPPEPVEFSGWYLRGDAGAGISNSPRIRSSFVDQATGVIGSAEDAGIGGFGRDRQDLGDVGFVDVGVGYQFNNWLRADITGEVRSDAKFSTSERYSFDYNQNAIPGQFGQDIYHGSVQSSVFLANVYADLGTWYGITGYIGGGVGAAYHRLSALTDVNPGTLVNFTDGTSGVLGQGGAGFADGKSKFNLAYAAMAGVTYDINANLKLDVGYRYLNMGSVTSNNIVCFETGCGGGAYERQKIHLSSNDVRVGLRWMINDVAPAPAYYPAPEAPIVRKY